MIEGRENLEKNYFLICPVRKATKKEKSLIEKVIGEYEINGDGIYYPLWDTNQNDSIGYNICTENKKGIMNAKKGILVYFNERSSGSMFDLGMAFMSGKFIKLLNNFSNFSKFGSLGKFLENYFFNPKNKNQEYKEREIKRKMISALNCHWYMYDERILNREGRFSPEFLFNFGMAFMSGKPVHLLNRGAITPTKDKSFENLLLFLDNLPSQ